MSRVVSSVESELRQPEYNQMNIVFYHEVTLQRQALSIDQARALN